MLTIIWQHRVATVLQFVRNAVSVKWNKVKNNEMRYVCIGVSDWWWWWRWPILAIIKDYMLTQALYLHYMDPSFPQYSVESLNIKEERGQRKHTSFILVLAPKWYSTLLLLCHGWQIWFYIRSVIKGEKRGGLKIQFLTVASSQK